MVLTRGQNQPGADGVLGRPTRSTSRTQNNTDSPWVDQSQTYTSHPSHQVFLREYVNNSAGRPVSTGKLLGGPAGPDGGRHGHLGRHQGAGLRALLGIQLDGQGRPQHPDDRRGRLRQVRPGPGTRPARSMSPTPAWSKATPPTPVGNLVPANVQLLRHAVPDGHRAQRGPITEGPRPQPGLRPWPRTRTRTPPLLPTSPARRRYLRREMLDTHFIAGDGRVNENIGLTAIHQIFHSEHDRLVGDIKNVLTGDTSESGVAALARMAAGAGAKAGTANASSRRPASSPRWSTSTWSSKSLPARSSRYQPVRAVCLHADGNQPRHQGGIRPRRVPVRPLHADRDHLPQERGQARYRWRLRNVRRRSRLRKRHLAARGIPQPAGLHRRRHRRVS